MARMSIACIITGAVIFGSALTGLAQLTDPYRYSDRPLSWEMYRNRQVETQIEMQRQQLELRRWQLDLEQQQLDIQRQQLELQRQQQQLELEKRAIERQR